MHPSRLAALVLVVAVAAPLSACSDSLNSPLDPSTSATVDQRQGFEALGAFRRYFAIGTSVSMGVNSDGDETPIWGVPRAPSHPLPFAP